MDFSDNFNKLKEKLKSNNLADYSLDELKAILKQAKEIQAQYKNIQLVVKADANSIYGVSASIYFSLCDVDIAEDITMTAKHFGVIVDRAINNFFKNWEENELKIIQKFYPQVIGLRKFSEYKPDTENDLCVYGDTDSRYIDLGRIYSLLLTEDNKSVFPKTDNKELSDFAVFLMNNFIEKIIKDTIDDECDYRNAIKGRLIMNHEVTARKCIFQKKKKYIMTSIWEDGKLLKKPSIKYKGVELKRGSSAPKAKKILGKLVEKYLLEDYDIKMLRVECLKLFKYIKNRKDKEFIYLISSVSGLNNIKTDTNGKFYSDKNHIQMQVALSWYKFREDNNLQNDYQLPFEGQKMNYYYCNPDSGYKVIGIPDDVDMTEIKNLPEPDWNRMINATLIKPLLRYVHEKVDIDDKDIEHFLLGLKTYNFSKKVA